MSYTGSQNGAADAILRDNIPCTVNLVASGGGPDPKPRSGAAGVTPGDGEIRLDLDSLVPVVQELFSAGVAASSMKAYRTGQIVTCIFVNVTHPPLSNPEDKFSQFVTFLFVEGLSGWHSEVISLCDLSCPDRAGTGQSEDSQYATPGLHL